LPPVRGGDGASEGLAPCEVFFRDGLKDEEKGMKFLRFFFLSTFLILGSCGEWPLEESPLFYQGDAARLLLYAHSTSVKPIDVEFTISWIGLEASDGRLIRVLDDPVDLRALDLIDRQILINEAFVEPGSYKAIKIGISNASIKSGAGRASLALPQPGGEVSFPLDIGLDIKQSFVVSFIWNPDKSVAKKVIFEPDIKVEPQTPLARRLLLFISNSASNYISIIDMSLERVIGALTVGDRPMGMVLNSTNDSLYVVNSGSNTISIVDTAHLYILDTIPLVAGIGPAEIVFMPDTDSSIEGRLYIINNISNDVTVVSTATKRILRTIAVGEKPSSIEADITRREVYVTNEKSNNVSIISADSDSVVSTVTVDNRPTGLAIGKENIYVFNEGSSTISIVSPSTRVVEETISLLEPPKRGLKAFSERLFVTNSSTNTLTFVDSQDVIARTLEAGAGPLWLAGDEQRERLYVTNYGGRTVTLFDPLRKRVVKELTVGKSPYGAVLLER
jgi:YVTN family beta-propeller protein